MADGGGIDWSEYGGHASPGTSAHASSPPASPSSPSSGGGIDWSKYGGTGSSSASAAPSSGGHGKSFLGRVAGGLKNAVEGLPAGLAQIGKDLGVTAVHAGENVVNDVAGTHLGPASGWRDHGGLVASQQEITDTLNQRPALRGMVEGFKRTGNEVVHPTQIARNYSADPVGSLLNDAANLSVILGPVAKVSGAASDAADAGRLSQGLGKAAHVTETVAGAPAVPFKLAGRGLGVLGGKLYEAAAENGGTIGETLRTLKVDPASIQLRREALTPGSEAVSEATGRQVALASRLQRIVPDPVEQEAMFVVGEGQAPALAKLRAAAPDQFDEFVRQHFAGSLSPQAARLAADVADGKAPDAASRIGQALQAGHEAPGGRAERSAQFLAEKPSRAFQAGFAPNPSAIDAATEKAMQGLPKAERLARTLRARADSAAEAYNTVHDAMPAAPTKTAAVKLGRLETKAQQAQTLAKRSEDVLGRMQGRVKTQAASAADSVDAAPARLRPVLETNRAVTSALADHAKTLRTSGLADDAARVEGLASDLPTTLKALQDAGVDPDHFIHIQPGDKATAAGVRSGASLPSVRKGRAEKFRGQSTVFDRSVRGQAQAEIDQAKTVIARQTADKIATMPFATRLDQGPLEGITTKEAAAKAGYVAWDPRSPFETPATVNADTVFLPEQLKNGFRSYFGSPTADRLLKLTYDPLLGVFKGGVLALSPSWHIGNIFGNLSMATIGGGVGPVRLARSITEAVKQYRASGEAGERSWEAVAPRRLFTAGPTHEELHFLNDAAAARKGSVIGKAADTLEGNRAGRAALGALRAPGAVARKSYALNEFVDNIGRSAVYLAKKAGGAGDEAALRESLKAMGDFSRMTPFERRVVRRVIPFYAWQRHITQLAFRLPVEAPLRTAWLLHLGDTYAQQVPDDGTPDYLRFAIPLGGKLLEASRFVPFGDAGRPLEPSGIESSLSPLIKIPIEQHTGINLTKGKPFTRPAGTGRHDEFGGALPTAPSLAKQATDLFPQKRLLGSLTGRDQVVRYDTGDKVLTKAGPIPSGKSTSLGVLRTLGVPLDDKAKAEEMAKSVTKKQKSEAKLRASYDRRRNK